MDNDTSEVVNEKQLTTYMGAVKDFLETTRTLDDQYLKEAWCESVEWFGHVISCATKDLDT